MTQSELEQARRNEDEAAERIKVGIYEPHYVTKIGWERVRPLFQQVWARKADRMYDKELGVKVYRVGNVVRIDIKDFEPNPLPR